MKIICFGYSDRPCKVHLLCEFKSKDTDGTIHFHCLNGAWEGTYKDGNMDNRARSEPMTLLYEGEVVYRMGDYNAVIAKVEQDLKRNVEGSLA